MSETIYKDAKETISNEQTQRQNDKNVKPEPNIDHLSDDEYQRTANGTEPTFPHPSLESKNFPTDLGNKWNKLKFYLTGKKSGGKAEGKQKIKSLNENSDD